MGAVWTKRRFSSLPNHLKITEKSKGIGLANIYQRLKLFYGDDIVFEIKSKPGEGTRVMIVLPDHVEER